LTFKTAPNYEEPSDKNGDGDYEVIVQVSDGELTDSQKITVTVTDVNDAPVITSNGGEETAIVEVLENTTAVTTVTATDEDGNALTYAITGGADADLFSIDPVTGELAFITAPDYEDPTDADEGNTYEVKVEVTDDHEDSLSTTQTITVKVKNVNEDPVITSNGGGDEASVEVEENTTAVTTVTAEDVDEGTTLVFSIAGGDDAALFAINPATGVLTFKTAPNYEEPSDKNGDGDYEVIVQVNDGELTDSQKITLTVTDVNDAPVITSNGGGETAIVEVEENTTAVTTVTATDEDGDALTYAITGGADADLFSIDPVTGELTFKTAPSYDTPADADGDNTYEVEVTVTDAGALSDTQRIQVIVSHWYIEPYVPPAPPVDTPATGAIVEVNGKAETAGELSRTARDQQTVDTISIDPDKLMAKLEEEGPQAIVTIPVNTDADVIVGELNGQLVKSMENMQATLEIKTKQATYTLPAQLINIDALAGQFGDEVALEDITIAVEIAEPTADWIQAAEDAAQQGSFTIVAPPVQFTVRATYNGQVIEETTFTSYVERTIAIPDGVDPNRITTGIVIEPDGTVRHVPTKVILVDGRYYARINSLTNSVYSVIWNPVEFADMDGHWARGAANDMGSRLVMEGTGEGRFTPDRDITRAEFAAMIVRGLGLRLEDANAPFTDVDSSAWYAAAVHTAYVHQLINGYEDGSFRPNEKITREQAMAIIARAMRITGLAGKLTQVDAEDVLRGYADIGRASKWALDSIAENVQAGIVTGRDAITLAPQAHITRAEAAVMIQRLLRYSDLI